MERVDPVDRARMPSGDGSERRHSSYVKSPFMVQLTWDTTQVFKILNAPIVIFAAILALSSRHILVCNKVFGSQNIPRRGTVSADSPSRSNSDHGHVTKTLMQCSWFGGRWVAPGARTGPVKA